MCRLALFSNEFFIETGKKDMLDQFNYLEKAMGGSGNGCAVLSGSGKVYIYKGCEISNESIVDWLDRKFKDGCLYGLYHTRMATHGPACRANCHPFKHGKYTVAHNGVAMHERIGNLTDSEVVVLAVSKGNSEPLEFENFSGVWIGFKGKLPFLVKGASYTDLVYCRYQNTGAWMFTSVTSSKLEKRLVVSDELGKAYWYGEECALEKKTHHIAKSSKFTQTSWINDTSKWEDDTSKDEKTFRTVPPYEFTPNRDWIEINEQEVKYYDRVRYGQGKIWGYMPTHINVD